MKNFLLLDLLILFEYYFIIKICCKNIIKDDKNNNKLLYKKKYDDNNILKNKINNYYLNNLNDNNSNKNNNFESSDFSSSEEKEEESSSEEKEEDSSSEEYLVNIPVYLENTTIYFYSNKSKFLNLNKNQIEINNKTFIEYFKNIIEEKKYDKIKNLILNLSDTNYSLNSFNSNNIDNIEKNENFILLDSNNFSVGLSLELNGIIFEDPVFYLSYYPENFKYNNTSIDLLSYYSIFPTVFIDYFFNNFFNSKDKCINSTISINNTEIIFIKCLTNKVLISTIHKKLYIILKGYVFPYENLFNEEFFLINENKDDNYTYFNIIFKDNEYIILGHSFFHGKKIGFDKKSNKILIYSEDVHNFSKFYKNLNNKTFKLSLYIITISIISILIIFFFIRFCIVRYERKKEKNSLELNQFSFEKKNN